MELSTNSLKTTESEEREDKIVLTDNHFTQDVGHLTKQINYNGN